MTPTLEKTPQQPLSVQVTQIGPTAPPNFGSVVSQAPMASVLGLGPKLGIIR